MEIITTILLTVVVAELYFILNKLELLKPKKVKEIQRVATDDFDDDKEEELFEEAKTLVIETGRASPSLLQRRLQVGYLHALRLLDTLESRGVIGSFDSEMLREVRKSDNAS